MNSLRRILAPLSPRRLLQRPERGDVNEARKARRELTGLLVEARTIADEIASDLASSNREQPHHG